MQRLADQVSYWFVLAVRRRSPSSTFVVWGVFGPEPVVDLRHGQRRRGADHRLPVRAGTRHADVDHGRDRPRGAGGRAVSDAEAIERLRKIDTLIVDKTGTLTQGKPVFRECRAGAGFSEDEVLRLAASLDQGSEHPLADAIVAEARRRNLALERREDFESSTGIGVRGQVAWRVGGPRQHRPDDEARRRCRQLCSAGGSGCAREGASAMFLAVDGRAAGLVAVADPIKDSTPAAMPALQATGLRIVMATGDGQTTAEAVARQLGIDEVHGEVRPQDKAALVARLQAEGRRVAMAGDGINDAPALAAADVGIAMGTGTDVAMSSAQVTLGEGRPAAASLAPADFAGRPSRT